MESVLMAGLARPTCETHRRAIETAARLMGIPYLNALWDVPPPALSDFLRDRGLDDEADAVLSPPRVFFAGDPDRPSNELWHYVYLHGEAEVLIAGLLAANDAAGWLDEAYDLCVLAGEQPTKDGEYRVDLHGRPAAAVISRTRFGIQTNLLGGRVALIDDPVGLAHAREYNAWM